MKTWLSMGNDPAVSHQSKHTTVPQPSFTRMAIYPREKKTHVCTKNVYENIHGSFIYNSQWSRNNPHNAHERKGWINSRVLCSSRRLLTKRRDHWHTKAQVDLMDIVLSNKRPKCCIYPDSMFYSNVSIKQNYKSGEQLLCSQGRTSLGSGVWLQRQSKRSFIVVKGQLHAHAYGCAHLHIHTTYMHTLHTYLYTYIPHMYIYTCIHTYTHMPVYIHSTQVHIYIHAHIYTHTYHTQAHMPTRAMQS